MKKTGVLVILVCVLGGAGFWVSHSVAQGESNAEQKKFEAQLAWMLPKAAQIMSGNADEVDFTGKELLALFMDKAEAGDATAQYMIGVAYLSKEDTPTDDKKAGYWFGKAAAGGNSDAQHLLGLMHLAGVGVEYNPKKAVELVREAADAGNAYAMFTMCMMYTNGKGTALDYEKAFKWGLLAAEHGHLKGMTETGARYIGGVGVEKDYHEAIKWLEKPAESGNADAQGLLGSLYSGAFEGVEADDDKSFKWLKLAVDNGVTEMQVSLGANYVLGKGTEKDYAEARRLFLLAAERNDELAFYGLGTMYEKGRGVPVDIDTAILWYKKAAKLGYINAKHRLEIISPTSDVE